MKFLDTSFLIDIVREHPPAKQLLDSLDEEGPHIINTIVAHEFLVGAFGATKVEEELEARKGILSRLIILNFDLDAANRSARIEADLRAKGEIIGGADILIAGTMISFGLQPNSPTYVLFAFPILGCFLASLWIHNLSCGNRASDFIKTKIYTRFNWDPGWEDHESHSKTIL